MKLPIYVTIEDKQKIAKLIHKVRKEQGYKNVSLLQKIILVAAYVSMVQGKITFANFLQDIERHVFYSESIKNFWKFEYKAKYTQEKFFGVPYKIVYEENINTVEQYIIRIFYGEINENSFSNKMMKTIEHIKTEYKQDIAEMFNGIDNKDII